MCDRAFITMRPHVQSAYIMLYVEVTPESVEALDMLHHIAEAVSRPSRVQTFRVTPFSLGSAASAGISSGNVISFLKRNSKNWYSFSDPIFASEHPVSSFIETCLHRYGCIALSFGLANQWWLEAADLSLLQGLCGDNILCSLCASSDVPAPEGADRVPGGHLPQIYKVSRGDTTRHIARLVDAGAVKAVAKRCLALGYPVSSQYNFHDDATISKNNIVLRSSCAPRDYQTAAVNAVVSGTSCRSGVIVLPCGAGKTLVGIMLAAAVKRRTLIVCAGAVSVAQWRAQLLEFATLSTSSVGQGVRASEDSLRVSCITGREKDEVTQHTDVIITTYTMLSVSRNLFEMMKAKTMTLRRLQPGADVSLDMIRESHSTLSLGNRSKLSLFDPFGLVLLDEVHMCPAEFFQDALGAVQARATVGLTATYVREDDRIQDLFHLVGPKLFDIGWETLAEKGHLAKVLCAEVHCAMSAEFSLEYATKSAIQRGVVDGATHDMSSLLTLLAAANPNKMKAVLQLVSVHRREKVLVFCDHIELLRAYGALLRCPVVCGATPHKDRMMIFSDFQSVGDRCNVICISRVGDISVNLPSASVVIQVSSHGGSRRQEAQRLGRILRPKGARIVDRDTFPPGSDSEWISDILRRGHNEHADAYFYSLVSEFTVEVPYAVKRSQFLVDQGYPFCTSLFNSSTTPTGIVTKVEVPHHSTSPNPWSSAWSIGFLARITSSWELHTHTLSTSAELVTGARQKRGREDEGDWSVDQVKEEMHFQHRHTHAMMQAMSLVQSDSIVYHEF